jgi:outer membrane protein assembly factor BamD
LNGSGKIAIKWLATAIILTVAAYSCGGPYVASRVSVSDEKLRIADDLYERKKYTKAAVEYKDFLSAFAGDERGDYAQYKLAECYRMKEDYALASVEYRILINDYNYSEYVDDAFFLEGLCSFRMTQRAERDQTKSYEALARINRFMQFFPNSPRMAEAEKVRAEINDILAKKHYMNANLYFKRKHYRAATVYFNKVVEEFPDTVWAGKSWYYIGWIQEREEDEDGAAHSYSRATRSPHEFSEKRRASGRLKELSMEKSGG